jgi:hypothetical protein
MLVFTAVMSLLSVLWLVSTMLEVHIEGREVTRQVNQYCDILEFEKRSTPSTEQGKWKGWYIIARCHNKG